MRFNRSQIARQDYMARVANFPRILMSGIIAAGRLIRLYLNEGIGGITTAARARFNYIEQDERENMKIFALIAAAALLCFISASAKVEPADIVFKNGQIYTVNERQPLAQAIAVKGAG